MQVRKQLALVSVLLLITSPAHATVIRFKHGLNTYTHSIEGDQVAGELYSLSEGDQIDWIELAVTNHVDSNNNSTSIYYIFEDVTSSDPLYVSELELTGYLDGDGTYSILSTPFNTDHIFVVDFSTHQMGETVNASSDIEWRIFVSEVPEPSSFALLGMGGLALMRRQRLV
jgi:hypothetical protein